MKRGHFFLSLEAFTLTMAHQPISPELVRLRDRLSAHVLYARLISIDAPSPFRVTLKVTVTV